MQRAVLNIDGPREVEAAGELGYPSASGLGRRRAVLPVGSVKRFGFDVVVRQKRRSAGDTRGNRRDNSGMTKVSGDQPFEFGDELPHAVGRKTQREQFDGDHAIEHLRG